MPWYGERAARPQYAGVVVVIGLPFLDREILLDSPSELSFC